MCSTCESLATSMPLDVRSWICACGAAHDRDVNAAINVLAEGRRIVAAGTRREAETSNACGDLVGPPLAVAWVDEAGSLRGAA
ncbi:zinc ribbon domain-containing protein [Streptosporangium sp. G12]